MKKMFSIITFSLLAASCCTDEMVVSNASSGLKNDVALQARLRRITQQPTAYDDMVDGSSCFSVIMPYNVSVNGENVTVTSVADYTYVANLLDQNGDDEDSIVLHFPIQVIYTDYAVAVFSSQAEMAAAAATCTGSIELACLGFQYPVKVGTYNSHTRNAGIVEAGTNEEFFRFLNHLSDYDAADIKYPMAFVSPQGNLINIEDNRQLGQLIDVHAQACQQNPDPVPGTGFDDILVQGSWHISYFFKDEDETGDYVPYNFTFASGGVVTVTGGMGGTGSWSVINDDGEEKVVFTFSIPALEELEEDWEIDTYTQNLIKLKHISGGGSEIRQLHFSKN